MNESYIKDKIEKGLSGSKVTVTGDGTHFEAIIISQEFDGKNTLQRHKDDIFNTSRRDEGSHTCFIHENINN